MATWDLLRAVGSRTRLRSFIFYDGSATLFTNRASPLGLAIDASRVHSEFSAAGATADGESVTSTYGGAFTLRVAERPTLIAGYHRIERDTDRDNFLSAQEAAEYGLIDKVLVSREGA